MGHEQAEFFQKARVAQNQPAKTENPRGHPQQRLENSSPLAGQAALSFKHHFCSWLLFSTDIRIELLRQTLVPSKPKTLTIWLCKRAFQILIYKTQSKNKNKKCSGGRGGTYHLSKGNVQ